MSTPSDTPETDAEEAKMLALYEKHREVDWPPFDGEPYHFARKLERERDEAITARNHNRTCIERLAVERDQLRAERDDALRLIATLQTRHDESLKIAEDCKAYASDKSRVNDDLHEKLHELRARVEELENAVHLANGTADLAIKHRDHAEQRVGELEKLLQRWIKFGEFYAPAASHNGSCGPESCCDASCMDAAIASMLILETRQAIDEARKGQQ